MRSIDDGRPIAGEPAAEVLPPDGPAAVFERHPRPAECGRDSLRFNNGPRDVPPIPHAMRISIEFCVM